MFDEFTFDEIIFDGREKIEKTLTENLQVVSGIGNWVVGKLITQQVQVVANFLAQGTFTKTLSEVIQVVSKKLYQASHVFVEKVNVGLLFGKTLTALKTLTENIVFLGSNLFRTSLTLMESFVVVPIYSRVLMITCTFTEIVKSIGLVFKQTSSIIKETLISGDLPMATNSVLNQLLAETVKIGLNFIKSINRTFVEMIIMAEKIICSVGFALSETIQVIGNIAKQTGRILTEAMMVVSGIVKTTGKTLIQAIQMGFGISNQTTHTFIENIIATGAFQKILTAQKTFTEVINVGWQKIISTARVFLEGLTIGDLDLEFIIEKALLEVVKIKEDLSNFFSKIFKLTINVHWAKFTLRSLNYFENITTREIFLPFTIVRSFIEKINVQDISVKLHYIFYKVCADIVKISDTILKSVPKVFVQVIQVSQQFAFSVSKLFVEKVNVVIGFFEAQFGHILYENLQVASELANWSIGKMIIVSIKVKDSVGKASAWLMEEAIIATDNVIATATKLLIQTIRVGQSITRSVGRIFLENALIYDRSVEFGRILYKTLSDALNVAEGLFLHTTKVFYEALLAGDSFVKTLLGITRYQTIKITQSFSKIWTLSRVFLEAIKAAGNVFYQTSRTLAENIAVAGVFIKGTIGKVAYEIVKIGEKIAKSVPKIFMESIAMSYKIVNQAGKIFIEEVNIAGQFVLGVISKFFKETINVVQGFTRTWNVSRLFGETINLSANIFQNTSRIFIEAIQISGTFVINQIAKLLREGIKVGTSLIRVITRTFSEIVNVVGHTYSQMARIFTQMVKLSGTLQRFNIGKLLTEAVSIRTKLKFVLNGIQVGLWRKVARITGTWRKWGRTE